MINDDPSKRTSKEIAEYFWGKRPDGKYFNSDIEEIEEGEAININFHECRYELTNQNMRLAECTVHRKDGISHGFRLHPPHLWDIRDGVLFKKIEGQWVKFIPSKVKRIDTANNR